MRSSYYAEISVALVDETITFRLLASPLYITRMLDIRARARLFPTAPANAKATPGGKSWLYIGHMEIQGAYKSSRKYGKQKVLVEQTLFVLVIQTRVLL